MMKNSSVKTAPKGSTPPMAHLGNIAVFFAFVLSPRVGPRISAGKKTNNGFTTKKNTVVVCSSFFKIGEAPKTEWCPFGFWQLKATPKE